MKEKGWTPSKTNESLIGPLVKALEEDQSEGSYYYSWKATIAMAFKDEYYSDNVVVNTLREGDTSGIDIHKIANDAADRFLQQLMAPETEVKLPYSGDIIPDKA